MILDVLSKFSDSAVCIRDEVDLKGLDDNDFRRKMEKAFMIYFVMMHQNWVDGFLEIAERIDKTEGGK